MDYVELSLSEQMEYARSPNWETRISLASYSVLPEVADFMVENEKDPKVLYGICERLFRKPNSNICAHTLAKAAKKKVEYLGINKDFDYVLVNIALHLNTDINTIKYLYSLNDNHINWGIANNPNTPKVILNELAQLNVFDIDDALTNNPNTSPETRSMIYKKYPNGFFSCGYHYEYNDIKVVASGN